MESGSTKPTPGENPPRLQENRPSDQNDNDATTLGEGTVETVVLIRCKHCGERISSLADRCPHCGTRLSKRSPVGLVATIILLVFGALFLVKLGQFLGERPQEKGKRTPEEEVTRVQKQASTEVPNSVEQHYQKLLAFYDSNDLTAASMELIFFRDHDRLDYKDVASLQRKVEIATLEKEVRQVPTSRLEKNLEIYKKLLALEPQNPRFKRKVAYYTRKAKDLAQSKAKRRRQQEERQKRIARFGPSPKPSPVDGSLECVKAYLRKTAAYPDSLDFEKWSKVYASPDGWIVQCDYWSRNAFGGFVRSIQWFIIRHNQVVGTKEAEAYDLKG